MKNRSRGEASFLFISLRRMILRPKNKCHGSLLQVNSEENPVTIPENEGMYEEEMCRAKEKNHV